MVLPNVVIALILIFHIISFTAAVVYVRKFATQARKVAASASYSDSYGSGSLIEQGEVPRPGGPGGINVGGHFNQGPPRPGGINVGGHFPHGPPRPGGISAGVRFSQRPPPRPGGGSHGTPADAHVSVQRDEAHQQNRRREEKRRKRSHIEVLAVDVDNRRTSTAAAAATGGPSARSQAPRTLDISVVDTQSSSDNTVRAN